MTKSKSPQSTSESTPASDPASDSAPKGRGVALQRFLSELISNKLNEMAVVYRRIRLWLTLAIFWLSAMVIGYQIKSRYGMVIAFFLAAAANAMIFFYDEWRLMRIFRTTEIEGRDSWGVRALVRSIAKRHEHPMPTLLEVESETPFVFSVGLTATRLKIFISSSLAKRLSTEELQAVFTHEILRSKSGLIQISSASAAVADLWLLLCAAIDTVIDTLLTFKFITFFRPGRMTNSKPRAAIGPLTWLSRPVIAGFLRLIIHRNEFLSVDQDTVNQESTGGMVRKEVLESAFTKLDAYSKTLPLDLNLAEAALFPVDPLASHEWSRWTAVQPPLEQRALALTGFLPPSWLN